MAFISLQVIVIIFALFAWSRVILRRKDGRIGNGSLVLWSAVWAGVIIAVLFPQTTITISSLLGIQRPIDVLVYGSIIALFYMVFRLYVKLENLRHDQTKIVRSVALLTPRRKR
jgi:hypothetical protein